MSAGPFLDQEHARNVLRQALQTGRLPSAFLFVGPHGVGKEEAALALAQALNCRAGVAGTPDLFSTAGDSSVAGDAGGAPGAPPLGGCGTCSACTRIVRYTHPDVLVRLPLPRPGGGKREAADPSGALAYKARNPYRDPKIEGGNLSIGIEDVRALIRELAYAPVEGMRRVIIVREAERMTVDAQNALLKPLEEPPAHTLFVLTTNQPEVLLPTVRSRCRRLIFGPLPQEVIASYLDRVGITSEGGIEPAALARGSLKRAIRIAEEGVPGRKQALQLLHWAVEGRRLEAIGWAADYTFKSGGGAWTEARQILEELMSLTRDLAALEAGDAVALHNPDQEDFLRGMIGRVGKGEGMKALKATVTARGEVDRNINLALIYSTLSEALSPLAT